MKSKIIISCIILILVAVTTVKLMSNKQRVEEKVFRPDADRKVLVTADTVTLNSLLKELSYTGTFNPIREAMIISQVMGEIDGIYFEEGDLVSKGELLLRIDDDLLQAQLIAAEANYQTGLKTLQRYENASTSGGVSGMQVDQQRLSLKTAESQLKQINKQIVLSRITAPFSGMITMRDAEIGSVIGSMPVARISDLSKLKLEISVPEKDIHLFAKDAITDIRTDMYPGEILHGRIDYVSSRADEAHNYNVSILMDNSNLHLKAGMYASALIRENSNGNLLTIPRSALLGSTKSPQVFLLKEGKAVMTDIVTGDTSEELIEVISGLQEDDVVITSGHINLMDGSSVEVAE